MGRFLPNKILYIVLTLLLAETFPATGQVHVFPLEQLAALDPVHLSVKKEKKSPETFLEYAPDNTPSYFNIWSKSEQFLWSSFQYLVLEVEHHEPHSLILTFDFYKKGKEQANIHSKIGVLPHLRTNVVYPLSFLNNQSIFLPPYPRQLKGIVMGEKIEKDDIIKVKIDIAPVVPPDMLPKLRIFKVYLSKNPPPALTGQVQPIVDALGQWQLKKWPGKTKDIESLKKQLLQMDEKAKEIPQNDMYSKYGGWLKLRFDSTGFFRTHHDGKRWWLVDPAGYAFISTGVDCIRPAITGPVEGMEELFPPLQDEIVKFKDVWFKERGRNTINWLALNYQRVFGENWQSAWEKINEHELKKWGFNTIANWSDVGFAKKIRMPYLLQLEDYPTTSLKLYRDFPDVFDPAFTEAAAKYAQQLQPYKDDKYLIGYFLANEPQWAFGTPNLALEVMKNNNKSFTKSALIDWLKNKYTSAFSLNQAWGSTYASFDELLNVAQQDFSQAALADLLEFSYLMVRQYIQPVCEAVKQVAPNHLNLGLRYAYISSDLCYEAGSHFDVFSINGYGEWPPAITQEITARTQRPVIIGEFHFGSTDLGLPSTGLVGAKNVDDRAKYIRRYVEQAVSRKEIVGVHYFQWYDQPLTGRFDGENYCIGLYDITGKPIQTVLKEYKKANKNIYQIAAGKRSAYAPELEAFPTIAF